MWQTRSTSKRADVILDLSATTPAESSKTPRHVAAKQKTYASSTTFTRNSARFKPSVRIWTCTSTISRPEKSDQPKQAGQEFGHMRRPVLGMNWGATWERSSRFPFGLDAGRRACSICPIREALASSHKHTLAARYMERIEAAALHGILVQSTVKRATGNPPDDPYSYRLSAHSEQIFTKEVNAEGAAPPLRYALLLVLSGYSAAPACWTSAAAVTTILLSLVSSPMLLGVLADGPSASAYVEVDIPGSPSKLNSVVGYFL